MNATPLIVYVCVRDLSRTPTYLHTHTYDTHIHIIHTYTLYTHTHYGAHRHARVYAYACLQSDCVRTHLCAHIYTHTHTRALADIHKHTQ